MAGVVADAGVRVGSVDMRDLLSGLPRRLVHVTCHPVTPGGMEPAALPALRAEQFLQLLVAQHQHAVRLDIQSDSLVGHAPRTELHRAQQVQEVLLAVALDPLIRVCWSVKLALARSADSAWGRRRLHESHHFDLFNLSLAAGG